MFQIEIANNSFLLISTKSIRTNSFYTNGNCDTRIRLDCPHFIVVYTLTTMSYASLIYERQYPHS